MDSVPIQNNNMNINQDNGLIDNPEDLDLVHLGNPISGFAPHSGAHSKLKDVPPLWFCGTAGTSGSTKCP